MKATTAVYRYIFLIASTVLLQPHSSMAKWIYAKHDNWEILSERGTGQTQKLWQELQYFQQAAGAFFPKLEPNLNHPIRMIIVTKGKSLDLLNYKGKRKDAPGGYYLPRPHGDTIALFREATNYAIPHEFMHRLTDRLDLPSWANEGLATLFESFEVKRSKLYIGKATSRAYSFLYSRNIDWYGFFNSPPDGDQEEMREYYGLAWALAHYYFFGEGKEDRSNYLNLAAASRMRKIKEPDVVHHLGMNYEELHKTITKYLERGSYEYYKLEKDHFTAPGKLEFKKSDAQISEPILIRALIDINKREDAAWRLESLLTQFPDLASAYELKAQLKMLSKEFGEAFSLSEKAVQLGSTSVNPRNLMAACKLIEFGVNMNFLQPMLETKKVNVILKMIAPVLEKNPDDQVALSIASATWACAKPIPSEGTLNLLKHAVKNRPSEFNNWAVLNHCLIRANHLDEARSLLLTMRTHKDADTHSDLMDDFSKKLEASTQDSDPNKGGEASSKQQSEITRSKDLLEAKG